MNTGRERRQSATHLRSIGTGCDRRAPRSNRGGDGFARPVKASGDRAWTAAARGQRSDSASTPTQLRLGPSHRDPRRGRRRKPARLRRCSDSRRGRSGAARRRAHRSQIATWSDEDLSRPAPSSSPAPPTLGPHPAAARGAHARSCARQRRPAGGGDEPGSQSRPSSTWPTGQDGSTTNIPLAIPSRAVKRDQAETDDDDRPPICPACGVTMGIRADATSARFVCLECGFADDAGLES